ncbi:MAG: 4-hydroxythreonine-4-phosphate dehydrogenase PdxA [Opitutales bacterium]
MKPLALTCGDPAGIGPLIIAQWLRQTPARPPVRIYGPRGWTQTLDVDTLAVGPADFAADAGEPSEAGARVALEAMEAAAAACRAGECGAVVTGPVSKAWLQRVGYAFPGQTEFFAARWGGEPTMAFVGETLRVVLATWHEPLRAIPDLLEAHPELLVRAVERAHELALAEGVKAPRIAVCGLNPHAGEGGLLGHEERRVLDPVLDRLRPEMAGLSGCLPGDTVFWRARQGDFDVVVALYHDQGLAPLKTVEFDSAVNVTLGLPWVRTSPDHGTAFELARSGESFQTGSFARAVEVAERLSLRTCA